jgi:hypothetical protein
LLVHITVADHGENFCALAVTGTGVYVNVVHKAVIGNISPRLRVSIWLGSAGVYYPR